MGFLHKLWDETLAGPMPDSGLGKLRKYDSFSVRSSPPVDAAAAANSIEDMNITRSITVVRTNNSRYLRNIAVDPCSSPESPATPSTPTTPLTPGITGTPRGDFRRITTRKSSDEALESGEPRSLNIYDWFSLSDSDKCFGSLREEETFMEYYITQSGKKLIIVNKKVLNNHRRNHRCFDLGVSRRGWSRKTGYSMI
ncbi:dormancy-associated protein [Populus alba x Populus x berolinensis]|nr:dormancy-associated protein [Populus alba x Populus x berolinensis]